MHDFEVTDQVSLCVSLQHHCSQLSTAVDYVLLFNLIWWIGSYPKTIA